MAEIVGGALLSSFLKALFNSLASPDFIGLLRQKKPINNLLEKLKIVLWSANSLLNDAEEKQIFDESVKNWVDMLDQVLHEANDVIEEINTESLRRKLEGEAMMKKLIPSSFSAFDKAIKAKVENVIGRLEFVLSQKDFLGLKEGVETKRINRSTALLNEDPCDVYGRDRDKEAIVELLMSDFSGEDGNISVIPIVGMGGIGKTTLARLVYDDSRVKTCFNLRTWITVSDDFNVFGLAKWVLQGLTCQTSDVEGEEQLRAELNACLRGKRFFLVLDDVWNENYTRWNVFKSYLRCVGIGSKILVTTRSEVVASKMGSRRSHLLQPMSNRNCWHLFTKHAFHNFEPGAAPELEEIGKKIVRKCKGLPLAVISLAGLLRSVSDPKEWKKILKSEVWELQKRGDFDILPSLWLSYNYLPSPVKRCFAYCSIFPKDYRYEKSKIILLWMAEGFLQGQNVEDLGDEYFDLLISRSLFMRSSSDNQSTLLMHDLVHDLSVFISCSDSCVRVSDDNKLHNLTNKTRHLLYEDELPGPRNFEGSLFEAKFVHSFLALPSSRASYPYRAEHEAMLKRFGGLRVLCLSKCLFNKVPNSVRNLKHLRFLDLSRTKIVTLSNMICSLYNLQTLLLCFCDELIELPTNFGSLINLRHLDISNTRSLKATPLQSWNFKALQTLTKLVLCEKEGGSAMRALRRLPYSRASLEVEGLKYITDVNDVVHAEFEKKCLVTKLKLSWSGETNNLRRDRDILDALRPHPNLEKLDIRWFGGSKFSDWVAEDRFFRVSEVYLYRCTNCRQLPPFGQLPLLKRLVMIQFNALEIVSSEFYSSSATSGIIPFKSLEYLSFEYMEKLIQWLPFKSLTFPSLKELYLSHCPNLLSPIPHRIPSLTSLIISSCQKMQELVPRGRQLNTEFPHLDSMDLSDCPELKLPKYPQFPTRLTRLSVSVCNNLFGHGELWDLRGLSWLKHLSVILCGDAMDAFLEEGTLPANLVQLHVGGADVKGLNPGLFRNLECLETLRINHCSKLESLPGEKLPGCISTLWVSYCPLLGPRLEDRIGLDWHKVSHIPDVRVW